MLKELLKRLQKRELTEQQEQELYSQMQDAANLIEENTKQRAIEKAKREEINKDQVKAKNLDVLDAKIAEKQNQIKKLDNKQGVFILLYALILVGGIAGIVTSTTIGFLSSLSFLQVFIVACAFGFVGIAGMFPFGIMMGNKMDKLKEELKNLFEAKQQIIDEVNIDIEKLAIDNIKLTNLPKLTKNTVRTNEQVITEETINTI